MDVLGFLADAIGVLGAIWAVLARRQLKTLRETLQQRVRLPEVRKRIQKVETSIQKNLNDHAQYAYIIRRQVESCAAFLETAKALLDSGDHGPVDAVHEAIARYRVDPTEANGRHLANALTYLCAHLSERVEDTTWEK